MPFIGQQPVTGAYHKLDSITTSATATYNLQLNGGAYSPASANHLLVSLNGVIQAPQDSFTISGSTITFASALTASDNIDFIMAFGDVLSVGVPTDGSVNTSQLANSAVTDAKIAGVASSKLTGALPALDGSALTGVPSADAGTCSFMIDMSANQTVSGQTWTKLNFDNEETDPDSCFNTSTYAFTAPADGQYYFFGKVRIPQFTNVSDVAYFRFYVNNGQPSGDATESLVNGSTSQPFTSIWNFGVLSLTSGDVVDLRVYLTTGARTFTNQGTGFGGFRLK